MLQDVTALISCVYHVINVLEYNALSLGIISYTGVMGNAPATIKEILTEFSIFTYVGGLYFKYVP